MDSQKVKKWGFQIVRIVIAVLVSIIVILFLMMKFVLPDFQKKITNQTAGTIINTTVVTEEKHTLFNTKNDFLWGWVSIKLGVGKPVREKLNGEGGK